MAKWKWHEEYALYKGDELLAIGTVKEIAEQMGVQYRTILYYKYPCYKSRSRKGNTRILVKLED